MAEFILFLAIVLSIPVGWDELSAFQGGAGQVTPRARGFLRWSYCGQVERQRDRNTDSGVKSERALLYEFKTYWIRFLCG